MVKKYTKEEFDKIVAKGEARLGRQHFFGISNSVPVVQVLETLEQKLDSTEEKFHDLYSSLFAKAVANLNNSQDLRRIG